MGAPQVARASKKLSAKDFDVANVCLQFCTHTMLQVTPVLFTTILQGNDYSGQRL